MIGEVELDWVEQEMLERGACLRGERSPAWVLGVLVVAYRLCEYEMEREALACVASFLSEMLACRSRSVPRWGSMGY